MAKLKAHGKELARYQLVDKHFEDEERSVITIALMEDGAAMIKRTMTMLDTGKVHGGRWKLYARHIPEGFEDRLKSKGYRKVASGTWRP